MERIDRTLLLKLVVLALRPAVRFCMRRSIKLQDLLECVKLAYIGLANKELLDSGHKPNISRISLMTGVHRRDVMRFQSEGLNTDLERDLVTRVMGHWLSDKRFLTKSGEPRVLSATGEGSDFNKLCQSVSQDINPGTVFFELLRIKAISPAKGGYRLLHESYVPEGDPIAGFSIFADDGEALLATVEENVLGASKLPQFHARTAYDNVDPAAEEAIKRWFLKEGHELHSRIRSFVSQFDRDINPDVRFEGPALKVVFGAFGNVESKLDKKKEDR